MTPSAIIVLIAGIAFIAAYALWELGADHLVVGMGRFIIRVFTLGQVRIPPERIDHVGAIAAGAATVIFFFLVLLVATAFLG